MMLTVPRREYDDSRSTSLGNKPHCHFIIANRSARNSHKSHRTGYPVRHTPELMPVFLNTIIYGNLSTAKLSYAHTDTQFSSISSKYIYSFCKLTLVITRNYSDRSLLPRHLIHAKFFFHRKAQVRPSTLDILVRRPDQWPRPTPKSTPYDKNRCTRTCPVADSPRNKAEGRGREESGPLRYPVAWFVRLATSNL